MTPQRNNSPRKKPDRSEDDGLANFVNVAGVVVICAAIAYFVSLKIYIPRSLHNADLIYLSETINRWNEAGRPEGAALSEFMQGRRHDLVISNRSFVIGGTNYQTQFAVTAPKSHWLGTLFVTSNKTFIWLSASGQAEITSRK